MGSEAGSGGIQYISSGADLQPGAVYDVAATLDGTTVSFYVNGRLVSQAPQTAALTTNTGPLQIGSAQPNYGNSFDGIIDQLEIYNRALSPSEIAAQYANLSNGGSGVTINGSASNLIGGTAAGAGNTLSGNRGFGSLILGSGGANAINTITVNQVQLGVGGSGNGGGGTMVLGTGSNVLNVNSMSIGFNKSSGAMIGHLPLLSAAGGSPEPKVFCCPVQSMRLNQSPEL